MYFNDDGNTKYTCPVTGAHFEFKDMCARMVKVQQWRKVYEAKLKQAEKAAGINKYVEVKDNESSEEAMRKTLQAEKE